MSDTAFQLAPLRLFHSLISRVSRVAIAAVVFGAAAVVPAEASPDDPGPLFGGPGDGEPYRHRFHPRVLLAPMPERKPVELRSGKYVTEADDPYDAPPRRRKRSYTPRHYLPEPAPDYDDQEPSHYADAPRSYAPPPVPYDPEPEIDEPPVHAYGDDDDDGPKGHGFGRMFQAADHESAPPYRALQAVGRSMVERSDREHPAGDSEMPAGYTFLGQFIDHDLTLDTTSDLGHEIQGDYQLKNSRTPDLDLDSVYGGGPEVTPHLYRLPYIRVGRVISDGETAPRYDLFRTKASHYYGASGGKPMALLGDPRNDENLVVSQLHAAFVAFHNRTADIIIDQQYGDERERYCEDSYGCSTAELAAALPKSSQIKIFKEARDHVTHYYHRLILDDFLPRIIGPRHTASLIKRGRDFFFPDGFRDENGHIVKVHIPVEFAGASFRYGHSQVRESYTLRDGHPVQLLGNGHDGPRAFEPLSPEYVVDWSYFFDIGHKTPYGFNYSRRIDPELVKGLHQLHFSRVVGMDEVSSLAARNLARGRSLHLPSGQDVARQVLPALEARGLLGKGDWDGARGYDGALWQTFILPPDERLQYFLRTDETPLWYYILQEAEIFGTRTHLHAKGDDGGYGRGHYSGGYPSRHYRDTLRTASLDPRHRGPYNGPDGGHRLGPVGATIVGEVLVGLIEHYREKTGKGLDYRPLVKGSESRLVGLDSKPLSGQRYLMRNFLLDAGVVESH